MDLQEHIRKVLKEETKMSNIQKKILDSIDEFGLYDTIKMIGGYEVFNDILPDYFDDRINKIKLILDITKEEGTNGIVWFYDISRYNEDIFYFEQGYEDKHTLEHFITLVDQNGSVRVSVYEYDENGEMYDEYHQRYYININKLEDKYINEMFSIYFKHYLK
jgi:hypothetical protein